MCINIGDVDQFIGHCLIPLDPVLKLSLERQEIYSSLLAVSSFLRQHKANIYSAGERETHTQRVRERERERVRKRGSKKEEKIGKDFKRITQVLKSNSIINVLILPLF